MEVITVSPMQSLKMPRQPKGNTVEESKAYDEKEVAHILECIETEPLMWKAMTYFMLDSGCRRGEVAGLRWENVNTKTGEIRICDNLIYLGDRGKYLTTPKSGRVRTVFLTEKALDVLKQWKKEQTIDRFKNGVPKCEFVFCDPNGETLNPTSISRHFKIFGQVHNIRHYHPHALRHTMATLSIANGADVVSVSKKLGHASPSITLNVYSHANEEAQKRANDILADAIYKDVDKKEKQA